MWANNGTHNRMVLLHSFCVILVSFSAPVCIDFVHTKSNVSLCTILHKMMCLKILAECNIILWLSMANVIFKKKIEDINYYFVRTLGTIWNIKILLEVFFQLFVLI